jgi:uncharacterized protein YkwD
MGYEVLWKTRVIILLVASLLAIEDGSAVFAGSAAFDHREQFILSEINRIRAQQGLPQLRPNQRLCSLARRHSSNMAGTGYLSHTDSLGRDFKARLGSIVVERYEAGENVATNNFPDSARVAVQGWCQSPGHLRNILNERFTETGIGVAVSAEGQVFFTQIFLGK